MAEGVRPDVVEIALRQRAHLLAVLEARLGSRADAEDLLQTALLKVVEKQRSVRQPDKVSAWFARLLQNLLVDWYRERAARAAAMRRLSATLPSASTPDEELFTTVCQCIHAVLSMLKPKQADILRRVDLDGERLRDVAARLSVTANNARVRLHRARRALLHGLRIVCGICFQHGCLDCFCRRRPEQRPAGQSRPRSSPGVASPSAPRGARSATCHRA